MLDLACELAQNFNHSINVGGEALLLHLDDGNGELQDVVLPAERFRHLLRSKPDGPEHREVNKEQIIG